MKLSIVASAAALLALTSLPFGSAANTSLRSGDDVNNINNDVEEQELPSDLFFQAANNFIDASGQILTKDEMTKASTSDDPTIITPLYESSFTDNTQGELGFAGTRHGYYKFHLGGFNQDKHGNRWNTMDVVDFDNAWHQAFNEIHGSKDGIYFAGESVFKIEEESSAEDGAGFFSSLVGGYPWWWFRYYDIKVYDSYGCNYCPDDDSAMESFVLQDKHDPVFNNKSLTQVAVRACEIMAAMGNEDFKDVHDCSATVTTPEDFAKSFVEDVKAVQDVDAAAGSSASA